MGGAITQNPVGAAAGAAVLGSRKQKGVDASSELKAFDTNNDGVVSPEEREAALSAWEKNYKQTVDKWHATFNEDYRLDLQTLQLMAPKEALFLEEPLGSLLSAAQRQASFNRRILKLGPRVITPKWIQSAVARYMQFLELAKEKPDTLLVPTLDVDLIWHAHMLSPEDYREDCHSLLGRLLQHDDNLPEGQLEKAFSHTKDLWKTRFGSAYVSGPRYHQKQAQQSVGGCGGSGCASCGWGDEEWHQRQQHNLLEEQIVAEADGVAGVNASDGQHHSDDNFGWGDGCDVWDVWGNNESFSTGDSGDSGASSCGASGCGGGGCGG